MSSISQDLTGLLSHHFGYNSFRPLQEDIMKTILEGKDCLAVMPTGSGKSLCFQLPALCLPGLTLVISPLIALMKDQVDGLNANGIPAAFLNSSQSPSEQADVVAALRSDELRLLYIAPERLAVPAFRQLLSNLTISLIAIDEAHCISEWGHEFRPDYRNLTVLREQFPHVPCIALTATATPTVRDDIRMQLQLTEAQVFLSSFNRSNLTYHVYPKSKAFERLVTALREPQRLPAIIYCFSRKDTENLAHDLSAEGFTAMPYHAGLDPAKRRKTQELFMRDEVSIVTATIAFGMGIDKPDVRTVAHMDISKTIEGYYQETGRAGRDGLPSDCILFYSWGDKFKHEYFIEEITDAAQKRYARQKLQQMIDYGELRTCRRAYMLSYFGEEDVPPACEGCDRCLQQDVLFDATEVSQKILSAVIRTGERFGAAHVCAVLRGSGSEKIRAVGHDHLSVFGIVQDFDERQLRDLIAELIGEGLIGKAEGQYPTLSVTDAGKIFLKDKKTLRLRKPEECVSVAKHKATADDLAFDADLFEQLRSLRRLLAEQQQVAAFVIFGDRTLREMAAYLPQSGESLLQMYGISDRKLEQYGAQFLEVIRSYAQLRGLQEKVKPGGGRLRDRSERVVSREGSTYEETRVLANQHLSLAEIARRRNLKESTIAQHIEAIVRAGLECTIAHLKPPLPIFEEIAAVIRTQESEALSPIFQHFNGKYMYEQIRLVRAALWQENASSKQVIVLQENKGEDLRF